MTNISSNNETIIGNTRPSEIKIDKSWYMVIVELLIGLICALTSVVIYILVDWII